MHACMHTCMQTQLKLADDIPMLLTQAEAILMDHVTITRSFVHVQHANANTMQQIGSLYEFQFNPSKENHTESPRR